MKKDEEETTSFAEPSNSVCCAINKMRTQNTILNGHR